MRPSNCLLYINRLWRVVLFCWAINAAAAGRRRGWRRRRDSNPRYALRAYNGLANRRLQPLGHVSADENPYGPKGFRSMAQSGDPTNIARTWRLSQAQSQAHFVRVRFTIAGTAGRGYKAPA